MSASKCLTEINKVQSFLKRINDKMADAIFFFFFFCRGGGWSVGWGSCIFEVTNMIKNCGQLTRDCEDWVHLELSCDGFTVTCNLHLVKSFSINISTQVWMWCCSWEDLFLWKCVLRLKTVWGGNERPSISKKIVPPSPRENPTFKILFQLHETFRPTRQSCYSVPL